jgi:hypothetical protein
VAADKVDRELTALFKEYDTLRTDLLMRVRNRFELLSLLVAGAAIMLAAGTFWLLLPFCLVLGGLWFYFGTAVIRFADRIVEIEARVNALVRSDDPPSPADPLPMQWETRRQGTWKRKRFPHW